MSELEKQYDEIIAPMLLEVSAKCRELGLNMVARVEWEPDKYGITQVMQDNAGIGQKLTHLAAHSRGNIDLLCIEAMKRFDCSQSAILYQFTKKNNEHG